LLGTHGVDEKDAGYFAWVVSGEATDHEAAEGVAYEEVGRSDAGSLEECVEFVGEIGGSAVSGCGAAPTEAQTVVGDCGGLAAYFLLEPCPVLAGGAYAGLEDNGGCAFAHLAEVDLAVFAYVDEFV
jgi:hypothetical protein